MKFMKFSKLLALLCVITVFSCASTGTITDRAYTKQLAAFSGYDSDGERVTTKILEGIKANDRYLKVIATKNGKSVTSIHDFSDYSFNIDIDLTNHFPKPPDEKTEPETIEETPSVEIVEFEEKKDLSGAFERHLARAEELTLDGEYYYAIGEIDSALEIRPKSVKALAMKGSIYYVLKKNGKARTAYDKALEVDPGNREIKDFIEYTGLKRVIYTPPASEEIPAVKEKNVLKIEDEPEEYEMAKEVKENESTEEPKDVGDDAEEKTPLEDTETEQGITDTPPTETPENSSLTEETSPEETLPEQVNTTDDTGTLNSL